MNSSTANQKNFMNTKTGVVDTEENLVAQGIAPAGADMIEVVKNEKGEFVKGGKVYFTLTY